MQIGIDLGSRTIKVAVIRDGNLLDQQLVESGFDPYGQAMALIGKYGAGRIVATGYGRHLAAEHFAHDVRCFLSPATKRSMIIWSLPIALKKRRRVKGVLLNVHGSDELAALAPQPLTPGCITLFNHNSQLFWFSFRGSAG